MQGFLNLHICPHVSEHQVITIRKNPETINEYIDQLQKELKDILASNVIDYDETNLSDDPDQKLVIVRRGCKYPERAINSTKALISVMFVATGNGTMLPLYVVYKSEHNCDSWAIGGPANF